MKVKINVTKDDIKKGRKGSSNSCPIARALKRTLKPDFVDVSSSIAVDDFYMDIAPKMDKFIDNFDDGKPVAPFEFWFVF